MEFKEATDRLTDGPTLDTVAGELGVSSGLIRQARMDPASRGFRNPPAGWQAAVAKLARERATALLELASALDGSRATR